jgi:hypothetical protein
LQTNYVRCLANLGQSKTGRHLYLYFRVKKQWRRYRKVDHHVSILLHYLVEGWVDRNTSNRSGDYQRSGNVDRKQVEIRNQHGQVDILVNSNPKGAGVEITLLSGNLGKVEVSTGLGSDGSSVIAAFESN